MFAGASHTLLTWVIFAFETTRQPLGLLPLLGGASAAYLIAGMGMRDSIMTQKISRRGVPLAMGPEVDFLNLQPVKQWASAPVVTVGADASIASTRAELATATHKHQAFPVVDGDRRLVGVITRREIFAPEVDATQSVRTLLTRTPIVVFDDASLRDAADMMVEGNIGRLPVVTQADPKRVVGMITRSDLLRAHAPRLQDLHRRDEPAFQTFGRRHA
jgi:CBS domain-containing protein